MNKGVISVSVTGRTMSGKTTIMKKIVEAITKSLTDLDIEVEAVWGPDGPPATHSSDFDRKRLQAVARKTKVVVTEFQASKINPAQTPEDAHVTISYVEGIGYSASVSIMGVKLRKDFGDLPHSLERARVIANRLAIELGTEATEENISPRTIEWVQQPE